MSSDWRGITRLLIVEYLHVASNPLHGFQISLSLGSVLGDDQRFRFWFRFWFVFRSISWELTLSSIPWRDIVFILINSINLERIHWNGWFDCRKCKTCLLLHQSQRFCLEWVHTDRWSRLLRGRGQGLEDDRQLIQNHLMIWTWSRWLILCRCSLFRSVWTIGSYLIELMQNSLILFHFLSGFIDSSFDCFCCFIRGLQRSQNLMKNSLHRLCING